VTAIEPDFVMSACETAVIVTLPPDGGRFGAVYVPDAEIVPTVALPPDVPFTCQVTAVLLVFTTLALKELVDPAATAAGPEVVTAIAGVTPTPPPAVVPPLLDKLLLLQDAKIRSEAPRPNEINLFMVKSSLIRIGETAGYKFHTTIRRRLHVKCT
jgi:hypothetical protein